MEAKQVRDLMEAYASVYLQSEESSEVLSEEVEIDLFDLIKGHLLDEGYAETEEAATVIMANMSEEWKQSIIEQSNTLVTPEQRRADELKYGMRRTTQVPPAKPAGAKRGPRMPL